VNILITGAFGFVGTNLSAYLAEKGHALWALDVRGEVLKCESSKVRECGDVNTPSELQNLKTGGRQNYTRSFDWEELERIPWNEVDAVVHLAGKAHDTRNTSDAQSYFDVNVGLTKKIVSSLVHYCSSAIVEKSEVGDQRTEEGSGSTNQRLKSRTHALPKFILFSSVKAVADRVEGVLAEEAEPNPQTPYGKSKLEAEGEVLKCGSSIVREFETANGANCANEGHFRTYILRPCMIHGPGNKGNLNLLYGMVRKGMPWPLGAFENRRSFASIGNVCAVAEGLLTGEVTPGVYQVADDEALPTNELVRLMADVQGRRARIWKVPVGLIHLIAWVGDVLRLPLNSERLKKLTESYVVSNAKVKRALGWEQMPVSASEGMKKTLESFGSRQ
jgi:nucleoside-diphosphate-sugar epimerase